MLKNILIRISNGCLPKLIARTLLSLFCLTGASVQAELTEIPNFREYSTQFASAGQPSETQLKDVQAAGYERVVYIAYSDQERSLPHEDRIAKKLGLEYVHIPVEWNAPSISDFYLVAAALGIAGIDKPGGPKKTLLHCQVNYRASAFALLYRVIYQQVPLAQAKADMNSVWVPDANWTQFILDVLKLHNVNSECEGCDWTPAVLKG